MKKILYILLFCVLPSVVAAQVEKSVEVVKDYVPSVAGATKLPIVPNMVDTVMLRPDIDYSITPLAMATTLTHNSIRPATVTYWEFNRPQPFYLKLGAGYPFRSVVDFYASTQNTSTGYLLGYLNHDGRYADIRNDFGLKANSLQMNNRVGIAAGKYIGSHLFEGEFTYDNRLRHRYGTVVTDDASSALINYGEFGVKVRFGDDFKDLHRLNFNIALQGTLFNDASDVATNISKARQTQLGVNLALARKFGHHTIRLQGLYEHRAGVRAIADYWDDVLSAGVRYGYDGEVVDFALGADYYYDKIVGAAERHYVIPALSVRFNFGSQAFIPTIEVDGKLRNNSFATLTQLNPYTTRMWLDKSTIDYNMRVGVDGALAGGKLAYRIFAEVSIHENQLLWTVTDPHTRTEVAAFQPMQAHQTVVSFNGELEYKPSNRFHFLVGLHGYTYDENASLHNGSPSFEGRVQARYYAKNVSFGVTATMLGERAWSIVDGNMEQLVGSFCVPFTVDLSADVAWQLSSGISLFAELRNLADVRLYELPYYRDYGVGFMAGVKFAF
ncbi:MAG: hypothetical protein RRZ83_00060 [Alistipes sp.]